MKDHLDSLNVGGGEAFWNLVRANINVFGEVAGWSTVVNAPMRGQIADEDAAFCQQAAELLPAKLDDETWTTWVGLVKEQTDRKGKGLFLPLRMALTGRARGPEMNGILPLLGTDRAKGRLKGEVA